MSTITCFSSFSGSSALSRRSLIFALISVATRSMSAILPLLCESCARFRFRLFGFVADRPLLAQQFRHLHARQRFEERRNLRRHRGDVSRDLAHSGGGAVPG